MSDFSAAESALGYLYQARYALLLLLQAPEERGVVIETLDDIVLQRAGTATDLLQMKHHTAPAPNLTDSSTDLWKTVRIWSEHLTNGAIRVPPTSLTLITTATASEGSIAFNLGHGARRNSAAGLERLRQISEESENSNLKQAFRAFTKLSAEQQQQLVDNIFVLDNSPGIMDVEKEIKEIIRFAVDRKKRDALYERLEGWWFGIVVDQLRSGNPSPVAALEVHGKLRAIAEQFAPESLPIDFTAAAPEALSANSDDRMFVKQLRTIDVGRKRIEKAILDFYRAFEQRSRWAREDLLVGDEVEIYEARLIDEWERFADALTELLDSSTPETELKRLGREIFNWAEQRADFRIRPNVSEPYVMRGSYHHLANQTIPKVWWHPKFVERLKEPATETSINHETVA